ncbi:hypothetical protein EMCRGX_G024052 [Ephydatia muelleri]
MPENGQVVWEVEDPSEFRPELPYTAGKDKTEFRIYDASSPRYETVRRTYQILNTHQTVESVTERIEKYGKLNKTEMTLLDAVMLLDQLVDESDPDTSCPNSIHAFQTAERIREAHPDKDWFHLTGLLHDVGKVLALWGEPQWAVVGDTFPVGCAMSKKIVFSEFSEQNPDSKHPVYSTKLGVYEPNCGLNNLMMSFGHDEYMYRVLVGNNCKLPKEALYMVRFHSFYPWHTGGDYDYLCNDEDREMMKWVREFNKFDLYSKADNVPDPSALKAYYQSLVDKYLPAVMRW